MRSDPKLIYQQSGSPPSSQGQMVVITLFINCQRSNVTRWREHWRPGCQQSLKTLGHKIKGLARYHLKTLNPSRLSCSLVSSPWRRQTEIEMVTSWWTFFCSSIKAASCQSSRKEDAALVPLWSDPAPPLSYHWPDLFAPCGDNSFLCQRTEHL